MDFNFLDRARRSTGPLQVDLVETFAQGRISRRNFVKRGTVLGLSIPFMGAIIAACGSDEKKSDGSTGASTAGTTGGSTASTTGGSTAGTTGPAVAGGIIKIGCETPSSPLDSVAMDNLGAYAMLTQCFEFLCTYGDEDIEPGLALSWSPNADGSEWTFKLRPGVKWQDGTDFTAADVAATMDRMVEGKNSGLSGIIDKGAVTAPDPLTAVFTLIGPNGNFPYLVSLYNAQSCITPVDYPIGTTLDAKPNGTGPWKLVSYTAGTGAKFERSDTWWGGKTPLDGVEWFFSEDLTTSVRGIQGGEIDAIQQFQVVGGEALFADSNFVVVARRASSHRQVWMDNREGSAFADKRVRQAIALSMDRDLFIENLFRGEADIGNDHPVAPLYPFFDDSVPQRKKDVEAAKQLLADAGATGLETTLYVPQLPEIPQLAELVQSGAKEIGVNITLNVESTATFYDQWCLTYDPICDGGKEFGIINYGHRAVPDVYLNAAYATGVWNSAHYESAEFNAAFQEYQVALDVEGHRAACKKLQTIANEDVPYAIPYFYKYLAGHTNKFTGVKISALGHMFLGAASKSA